MMLVGDRKGIQPVKKINLAPAVTKILSGLMFENRQVPQKTEVAATQYSVRVCTICHVSIKLWVK